MPPSAYAIPFYFPSAAIPNVHRHYALCYLVGTLTQYLVLQPVTLVGMM